jgi:hypothetical protein
MPLEPYDQDAVEAPAQPHLSWLVQPDEDSPPEAMAIPVGSYIAIVISPKLGINGEAPEKGGVIPLILAAVSKTRLTFKCACGQKACTRTAKFDAKWSGIHPVKYK